MTYHKFVFDEKNRRFLGEFEKMYAAEEKEGYDSWSQDDTSDLTRRIALCILDKFNFDRILDVGCGKGVFTHSLKKQNNKVTGIDVSETAIRKARSRYAGIDFISSDIHDFLDNNDEKFDLVVMGEVLSYLETWREVIRKTSMITEFLFITLYLPDSPIGFVKTFEELKGTISEYFDIKKDILDCKGNCIFLLGKKKT